MLIYLFLWLLVIPQQNIVEDPVYKLGGINITIDCPLRFGSLRKNWSVRWIAIDQHNITINNSEYFIHVDPKYQLVIKNASTKYDRAKFQCRAIGSHYIEDSQFVTLQLFSKWSAE